MMGWPVFYQIFFLSIFLQGLSVADCQDPDLSDPDEYFDNIGRTDFCQRDDREAYTNKRNPETREDFGVGFANSNGGNNAEGGRAIAYGAQGVFYVAGRTNNGSENDFLIFKYFADGGVDTSFDTDGKVIHSFGNTDDWAHAIQVQTDGKVVVAGRSDHGSANAFDFAVLRLKSDGGVDTAFATTGKKTIAVTANADVGRALVLQTGGEILIAGYGKNSNYDFGFARLTTDGRLDTAFSSTGVKSVANGSSDDGALGVTLDSTGKIVAGGSSYTGANWDVGTVRLLTSGALDTSFYTTGILAFPINGGNDIAYGVATDNTNQIILAGSTVNGALDMAFVRLLTDGSFDTAFSTSGKLTQAVLSNDDAAYSIGIQTDGLSILGAGYANNATNNDFAVIRLLSSGSLDTSFATSGKFTKAIKSNEDTAQVLRMNGDGVIMVAGRTDTNGSSAFDIAILRLQSDGSLARSGQPVLSFQTAGKASFDYSGTADSAYGVAQASSTKILIVGQDDTLVGDAHILRLSVDGTLDTTFFTSGHNQLDVTAGTNTDAFYSVFINSNGSIVAGGATSASASVGFDIVQYNTDGSLDTSFATDGTLVVSPNSSMGTFGAVFLQSDGKYVAIGNDGAAGVGTDAGFLRMSNSGVLDNGFSGDGKQVIDYSGTDDKIAYGGIDANGNILAVGMNTDYNTLVAIRLMTDGELDTSFATNGKSGINVLGTDSLTHPNNTVLLPDSKIMLGISHTTNGTYPMHIVRLTTDGIMDTSFNTDGRALVTITAALSYIRGLQRTPNDKLMISSVTNGNWIIARMLSDGQMDTTFNTSAWGTLDFGGTDVVHGMTLLDNGWVCPVGNKNGTDFAIGCFWQ